MSALQSRFLRAKRWNVLVVALALACVAQVLALRVIFRDEGPSVVPWPFVASLEACAIYLALWLWSLGTFLHSVVSPELRLNLMLFRVALVLPLIYVLVFGWPFNKPLPPLFLLTFTLGVLGTFGTFYSFYFVSKSLALAEKSKRVSFPDDRAWLLGLWLFPIGIWFIQPRINRLYANRAQPLSS